MESVLHWSFDSKRLRDLVVPRSFAGSHFDHHIRFFNPDKEYQNTYDVIFMRDFGVLDAVHHTYYGEMTLSRNKQGNNESLLQVQQQIKTGQPKPGTTKEVQITEAKFAVKDDPLSTLANGLSRKTPWSIQSHVEYAKDPSVHPYINFQEFGRLRLTNDQQQVMVEASADGTSYKQLAVFGAHRLCTTNWGLFDAVQRLEWHNNPEQTIRFHMLHDLTKLYRSQTLAFMGSFPAILARKPIDLYGYCQVGEASMPIYYWVTSKGLLLIVRCGLLAYVWKGGAQ